MFVDTHCHLYLKEFATDIDAVMDRAIQQQVQAFYLPAIDSETHQDLLALERKYPNHCFAMMGLHPCSVKSNYQEELATIGDWLEKRKFAGIGEAGLDFYWDKTYVKEQFIALEQQIEWSLQYQLPIILHTRNATQETIDVVAKYAGRGARGIFHCFGGTIQEAKQIIDLGFYVGIGGVVTYKNAGLDVLLKEIEMKHIVLETDAPYLSPVPHRGKRNESAYLIDIAQKIAAIQECTIEEVARVSTRNAESIFNSYLYKA